MKISDIEKIRYRHDVFKRVIYRDEIVLEKSNTWSGVFSVGVHPGASATFDGVRVLNQAKNFERSGKVGDYIQITKNRWAIWGYSMSDPGYRIREIDANTIHIYPNSNFEKFTIEVRPDRNGGSIM